MSKNKNDDRTFFFADKFINNWDGRITFTCGECGRSEKNCADLTSAKFRQLEHNRKYHS